MTTQLEKITSSSIASQIKAVIPAKSAGFFSLQLIAAFTVLAPTSINIRKLS